MNVLEKILEEKEIVAIKELIEENELSVVFTELETIDGIFTKNFIMSS